MPSSPSGKGIIVLTFPIWWQIQESGRRKGAFDFEKVYKDNISSDCFDVQDAWLDGDTDVTINYVNMKANCIPANSQISIACRWFKNPIYQRDQDGYYVRIMDSNQRAIMRSNPTKLYAWDDTRGAKVRYTPFQITESALTIEPSLKFVNTPTQWTMALSLENLYLEKECYILLTLPDDLAYQHTSMRVDGIFRGTSMSSTPSTADRIITNEPNKKQILFTGCQDTSALTRDKPNGQVELGNIWTMKATYDSGPFRIDIFKDQDME